MASQNIPLTKLTDKKLLKSSGTTRLQKIAKTQTQGTKEDGIVTPLPRKRSDNRKTRNGGGKAAKANLREVQIRQILQSGLFDERFYLESNQDVYRANVSPIEHYFDKGYREGRLPNPYFDSTWYCEQYPDVLEAKVNPLAHYAAHGDIEGRQPGPFFDNHWYRAEYGLDSADGALQHYLINCDTHLYSPNPCFDATYYAAANPDVSSSVADLFLHFYTFGWREGRNPSSTLSIQKYLGIDFTDDAQGNNLFSYLGSQRRSASYQKVLDHQLLGIVHEAGEPSLTEGSPGLETLSINEQTCLGTSGLMRHDFYVASYAIARAETIEARVAAALHLSQERERTSTLAEILADSLDTGARKRWLGAANHLATLNLQLNREKLVERLRSNCNNRLAKSRLYHSYAHTPKQREMSESEAAHHPRRSNEYTSTLKYHLDEPVQNRTLDQRVQLILESMLFSPEFYVSQVASIDFLSPADAVRHYLTVGAAVGVKPHILFDSEFYLAKIGNVAESLTPFEHWLLYADGPDDTPHPLFDPAHYWSQFPVGEAKHRSAFEHFCNVGSWLGIDPHPLFSTSFYKSCVSEVDWEAVTPITHYLSEGWSKHFDPHPWFCTEFYREQCGTIPANRDWLTDFLASEPSANYSPHPVFDYDFYKERSGASLNTVRQALLHYLTIGWTQMIAPSRLFDPSFYSRQAGSKIETEPYGHYRTHGAKSALDPHPIFSTSYYAEHRCPERVALYDPLLEYLLAPAQRNDIFNPLFDPEFYRSQCGDDLKGMSPLKHYLYVGGESRVDPHLLFETKYYSTQVKLPPGRVMSALEYFLLDDQAASPCPLFDPVYYLMQASISVTAENPLVHFIRSYGGQGDPHWAFDTSYYLDQIKSEERIDLNPLVDFLRRVTPKHPFDTHPFFDSAFYYNKYKDVAKKGLNPLWHYLRYGFKELRCTSPKFDPSYYTNHYELGFTTDPFEHFARLGSSLGLETQKRPGAQGIKPSTSPSIGLEPKWVSLKGAQQYLIGRPNVLVCAHVAGEHLFGSERSFVDMVNVLVELGMNVHVALPNDATAYRAQFLGKVASVNILPYRWWRERQQVDEQITCAFIDLFNLLKIDVVHANTIMLREPAIAARRSGVRSVVHVRELISFDEPLAIVMGATPSEIILQVTEQFDFVIGNSGASAKMFNKLGCTAIVPNTVNISEFNIPNALPSEGITIGLISSNIAKKGIADFLRVAEICETMVSSAKFVVIGPETVTTSELRSLQKQGKHKNVCLSGYSETPLAAVASVNVVVNLSSFAESFGRTILEGMAARRPVLAYDWGALSELIDNHVNGFLISPGDVQGVALAVKALVHDPRLITSMGEAGRKIAVERYSHAAYRSFMEMAYKGILGQPLSLLPQPLESKRLNREPTVRRAKLSTLGRNSVVPTASKHRIAYFMWHFPVPTETFVLNELRELVRLEHDVIVFCKQIPHKDFKLDFKIAYERVASPEALARRLRETDRTIVHSHFVYPTVTDFVWPACEEARIPFTFIAHAQDIFRYKNDELNRIGEIAASPLCEKVFVPAEYHYNYVADRGVPRKKIAINPNGIDEALYEGGRVEARSLRKRRAICAIHRFTEKKGLENLIRAAKLLEDDKINIHLYGYGELGEHFATVIAETQSNNVELCGAVSSREHMLEIFREHDLFVCPSIRAKDGDMDGIPTILMEAMAAGLPVLTTDISGIPDLVNDGVTGLICLSTPASIAERVRRFYEMQPYLVDEMSLAAIELVREKFNIPRLTRRLIQVWARNVIDIIIVSWNNLPQLTEVIDRLFRFTSSRFHLIVCDNGSDVDVVTFLEKLQAARENVTIIFNAKNEFVGPGTNRAMTESTSDLAIYVCGKEGFVLREGWEEPFVSYMAEHPDVGLAGTLCHSPTYLKGSQYGAGIAEFPMFRNRSFAEDNPNRTFFHVQGGFFVIRSSMFHQIGGFSDSVPHNYTDVEYSFYAESMGWKLGSVPSLLALFNKTNPPLYSRLDDQISAVHPPTMDDLDWIDRVARRETVHCNVCGWQAIGFTTGMICGGCSSTALDRSLYKWLASTVLLHRRLTAISVGVEEPMLSIVEKQFQGPNLTTEELNRAAADGRRLPNKTGGIDVALVRNDGKITAEAVIELRRLLKLGGKLVIQDKLTEIGNDPLAYVAGLNMEAFAHDVGLDGFSVPERVTFRAKSGGYDLRRMLIYTRT